MEGQGPQRFIDWEVHPRIASTTKVTSLHDGMGGLRKIIIKPILIKTYLKKNASFFVVSKNLLYVAELRNNTIKVITDKATSGTYRPTDREKNRNSFPS